jgi:RNA polymerase sigma-70 factor (ECF subfamily)
MPENNTIEDTVLLIALRRGDKNAFDTLFRKYYPMLCAYGSRFVEPEDAEEVVQDIMLWLWEKRDSHQVSTSLSQYLFKAVYHGVLSHISRLRLKHKADTHFYREMQDMLQDTDFYLIEELSRHIHDAVMALPQSYREAFVMHRFKNMSYKEIAGVMNISPKTVDYRIQQALKQLRIDLKDYLPLALFSLLQSNFCMFAL